jgi:hypothetical protein
MDHGQSVIRPVKSILTFLGILDKVLMFTSLHCVRALFTVLIVIAPTTRFRSRDLPTSQHCARNARLLRTVCTHTAPVAQQFISCRLPTT